MSLDIERLSILQQIKYRGHKEICQQVEDAKSQFHLAVVLHICTSYTYSELLVCGDNKMKEIVAQKNTSFWSNKMLWGVK